MRTGVYKRKTNETNISVSINLDNHEPGKISTGIGFFDHMLELFAFRARINLTIETIGDLHVDGHHTVEDVGICLGKAIYEALGDKVGIARYGAVWLPMDESLIQCVLDISGRGLLVFNGSLPSPTVGGFETELVEEFFRALAHNAGITLHINLAYGSNTHHIIEGMFKAFGCALAHAIQKTGVNIAPSTKGVL